MEEVRTYDTFSISKSAKGAVNFVLLPALCKWTIGIFQVIMFWMKVLRCGKLFEEWFHSFKNAVLVYKCRALSFEVT